MYPLHQIEKKEKCFQISFNSTQDQYIIPEDLALGHVPVLDSVGDREYDDAKMKKPGKRGRKLLSNDFSSDHQNYEMTKMVLHREREKQRRQEMGSLYMSLRNLLPLEFIKGKRAISDQMNGAVNYIKYQKKRIKEMEEKRDKLKILCNSSSNSNTFENLAHPVGSFKINPFNRGLEIIIITTTNNCFDDQYHGFSFPLSKILKALFEEEEGLDLVNCGFSTLNDKSIHTLHMEVNDSSTLDISRLEKKLTEAVPLLKPITDFD